MTHYLNHNETNDDNKDDIEVKLEDNSQKVLYGLKTTDHDPTTHVKVRVLYHDDFPVDLITGIK